MADPSSPMSLVELAETRFGGTQVLPAERLLLEETAKGQKADCSSLTDRRIRSDLISWLCSDASALAQVTHHGIWLIGADIEGDTDLEHVSVSFPFRAQKCNFKGRLSLARSHWVLLDLSGSTVGGIDGNAIHVDGDVFLTEGFTSKKAVDFVGATITGDLDCHGGHFESETEAAAFSTNKGLRQLAVVVSLS